MNVLRQNDLLELAQQLGTVEIRILELIERFRFVQSNQIERLYYQDTEGDPAGRRCRRQLARLHDLGLVRRLERRIGGIRAGSAGHIYTLTGAGQRLAAITHDTEPPPRRGLHEPGLAFVRHTLAIADLYVRLRETERSGSFDLLDFETEPGCWRSYTLPGGAVGILKPDALAVIGVGDWEERSWVEIDLATVASGALTRKIEAYLAYYRSGREQATTGVFPRVAFLTTTEKRAEQISALARQAGTPSELVVTSTISNAIPILAGHEPTEAQR